MNTCRPQPVSAEIWVETKLITFVVNKGHASAGTLMTSDYWRSKVHADWGDGYIVNCQSGLKSCDINQTSWPMIFSRDKKDDPYKPKNSRGLIHGRSSDGGDFGEILSSPVKSLGAKSLAGLIAYPQLKPKQIPIASTVRPTKRGTSSRLTYYSCFEYFYSSIGSPGGMIMIICWFVWWWWCKYGDGNK